MAHLIFLLLQAAVPPIPGEECIKLKAVIGYNGNGRGNMVWGPEQGCNISKNIFFTTWSNVGFLAVNSFKYLLPAAGLFAYTCGSVVVVEYLHTGRQRHLQGHHQEISCLAITHNAEVLEYS